MIVERAQQAKSQKGFSHVSTRKEASQWSATNHHGLGADCHDRAVGIPRCPPGHAVAKPHAAPLVTVAELEQYVLGLINQSRENGGLPDYTSNDTLATVARDHSNLNMQTDPKNGCPDNHQCPGEPDPGTRISNAGVQFTAWGENVGNAWGEPTFDPKAGLLTVHQNMMNEGPGGGHYDNVMSSDFQQVGVGVAFDANHVWVTEDFIKP